MSRRRVAVHGVDPMPRIRDSSRLMRTHETMVDFINGRHARNPILDVFSQGFFGLDFLRNFDGDLEDDFVYSDEDDDDSFNNEFAPHRPLEPHPRIRQLTEEEADKHGKELIAEEERRKDRTERNKRKKLRKKKKKRLEKENAAKSVIPEEEQNKSDSSENPEEDPPIKNKEVNNDSPEPVRTQDEPEAARCEESAADNKEESLLKIDEKEEVRQKDLDLNNSEARTDKPAPVEKSKQKPAKEQKKEKDKLPEVQESKEETPNVVEKPEVQKKIEEKLEPVKENQQTIDPAAEEFARISREYAGNGNRFAAAGQYDMAVKYFTDAIKYNPKEFKLFGNRSLCYERLQQYENALMDADIALCMEPNWIKGLFRKGKALCGLKRYYEASLIYKKVLMLERSSLEAMQELKRAQTLHLMEMGFTWAQSSEALKAHATLEEAVEALFGGNSNPSAAGGDATAHREIPKQPLLQEEEEEEGEWIVQQTSRPRMPQFKEFEALDQARSNSQSPTPKSRSPVKPALYSVWVGSMAPAVTYATLHEVFSRAGTVYSIKMLLEQQCAFINYTKKEDCDRAVQCINGMVVEGAPLSVRHPGKFNNGLGSYKKECFFWRTSGCTRQDCTFRHVPESRGIDKERFTSRLGNFQI
ncbi:tetratricopeptide repeat protein 31 isoform X2 [Notolabrus celidotus]|uniref:tetratricopeptide repeat protein 31 isoform X2 n=1 Tax=Notolabrus celidotus TaxID=1203425 RepID=UPI00148FAD22|nr:tetratricopeptide repeat protein 31 isoform X2 [Notolabrus celidotus]